MILQEIKKALFPLGASDRVRSSALPTNSGPLLEFSEPSQEIRAAVRRRRLGQPTKSPENPRQDWSGPAEYAAYPVHRRASTRGGIASSDALVVTRFLLSGADDNMTRLIGEPADGRSVLDFDLRGLELAWHSDLMRALEDRAAIWSISRIVMPDGEVLLEHIVIPCRNDDGQLAFAGWYHRIGGSLVGELNWSEVQSVGRQQRGRRISGSLPEEPLVDVPVPDPDNRSLRDVVSQYRKKGAL